MFDIFIFQVFFFIILSPQKRRSKNIERKPLSVKYFYMMKIFFLVFLLLWNDKEGADAVQGVQINSGVEWVGLLYMRVNKSKIKQK